MSNQKVIITIGDPAGCGPQITLDAVYQLRRSKVDFLVVGAESILSRFPLYKKLKNRVNFVNVHTPGIDTVKKGYASECTGLASLNYLDCALEIMKKEGITRLVTAPVSKEAVQQVVPGFCGHTEYLAQFWSVKNYAMMMVAGRMRFVLFTRHVSLRNVARLIKAEDIGTLLLLLRHSLKHTFGIRMPKIAFASVNPHAGILTHLEREEKIICRGMRRFKTGIYGPFPSDSLFIPENIVKYDCIVCAYHDQAMIPFKLLSMRSGVNVTLGLPIIRTSPAHGVAYDLMRSGKTPFSSSMEAAVKLAMTLKKSAGYETF